MNLHDPDLGIFPRSIGTRPENQCLTALGGFLLSRAVEGCSPATLKTYRHRISQFIKSANNVKPGATLPEINRGHIESYLLELRNKGNSPEYIKSNYVALNVFFKWCLAEGFITEHPMRNMKLPRIPKKTKPFLTEQQRDQLLALCPPSMFIGARNTAVIWLLWTTGMRLSELANLQLDDLDWQTSRIKVVGKGSKERHVPFLKQAKKAVWRYLAHRNDDHKCLWVSEEKRPITKDGLDTATQRLIIRAGLQGQIRDLHHIFRRTWAMRQVRSGIPLKYVQLIGGWESVTTLEGYIRAMDTDEALKADWV